MAETFRFQGFYYPHERYADSRLYYQEILKSVPSGVELRETELARQQLEFLRRFPPEVEHSRTVGHQAQVIQLDNPRWERKGKFLVPDGLHSVIADIDIVEEVHRACVEDMAPGEVLKENAIHTFSDGTRIVGVLIKEPHLGSSRAKRLPLAGLHLQYDPSGYVSGKGFEYQFGIDTSLVTPQNPLEFLITQRVVIDGIITGETRERARAFFSSTDQSPTKLHHMVYSP